MLHWHFKAPQRQRDPAVSAPPGDDGTIDSMADPMTELATATPLDAYEALRDRGDRALGVGDLAAARGFFERALEQAEATGDPDLRDRALCNLAGVVIELGEGAAVMTALRQILMKGRDDLNCYLATYALSRAHDLDREYKKAIFYARIGLDRVAGLDAPERAAVSHNQMGNLLLAENHLDEACAEYELALTTTAELPELSRALILDNVGYCRLLTGRRDDGFRLLFESLRSLRRLGARLYERYPHLALAFGYLEIDRHHRAAQHGFAALRLAEEADDRQTIKNALYLLGETARLMGAADHASRCFEMLQRRFYPGQPELARTLMAVDVRGLLHLRA